jgi:hypothetical protein
MRKLSVAIFIFATAHSDKLYIQSMIEPSKDQGYSGLHLNAQSVPRSKHTPSVIKKTVS